MAEHRTVRVIIADYWGYRGGRGAGGAGDGTITGVPAPAPTPPVHFNTGINGDLLPGDLIVHNTPEFTAYNTNSVANQQAAYSTLRDELKFSRYDEARGVVSSVAVRFGKIERITATAPQVRTPQVTIFHFAYNSPGITNTVQGSKLTVRVAVDRTYSDVSKKDFFASVTVGPEPPTGIVPLAATDREIQDAHFRLLRDLLASDPQGLFFDKDASIAMSNALNYQSVVLVGALKRVFNLDKYAQFRPVRHDVALVEGTNQDIVAITNMDTLADIAAYNNSLAIGTEAPFVGNYTVADPGSGYPDHVEWIERQFIGNLGARNAIMYPDMPNTLVNRNIMYGFVGIDHIQTLPTPLENTVKTPLVSTYIYLGWLTGVGTYQTPLNWQTGTFTWTTPPVFVANPVPTVVPFPAGVGTRALNTIAAYGPPAVTAQTTPNSNFNGTGNIVIDGTVGTFIQALSNQLVS